MTRLEPMPRLLRWGLPLVILFLVLLLADSFQATADSPSHLSVSNEARALLQRMLTAQQDLSISGEQITTVYRNGMAATSTQSILRMGDRALRMEYHSPASISGRIIVDDGTTSWTYKPRAKVLEVGNSHRGRLRQDMGFVQKMLKSGDLNAQIEGQDTVAGRRVEIVSVKAGPAAPSRRFWIDPANGAQLKIESYGPDGQLLSTSFYTSITYDAALSPAQFVAPPVPPDVLMTREPPPPRSLNTVPTAADAGFAILTPTDLPPGFRFQSATISTDRGQPLVQLKYTNGLSTVSVFESPDPSGKPEPMPTVRFPRAGVLSTRAGLLRLLVIGNLPNDVLLRIAQSAH